MMNGKQKLYFLLDAIDDARILAPAGKPLLVDPTNDLNRKYKGIELDQLFSKLQNDVKVLKVLQVPNRVKNAIFKNLGEYENIDDGYYHIELLPAFDAYFLNIQHEPEYQEFTGKIPTRHIAPAKYDLSTTLRPETYTKPKSKNGDPDIPDKDKPLIKDATEQKVNHSVKVVKKFNTNLWIQNLEAIYQQALTARPTKPFFLAVYDYVNYVLTTDTLAQLSEVFYVHKKADYETAEQYKKDLIEYIDTLIPNLEQYKTNDPAELDNIKEVLSIKNGTTQVMGDPEGWLSIFGAIERICWDAFRNDAVNEPILSIIGVEENDGKKVTKWKALEIHDKYKAELDKMERIKQTRGWHAWEYLRLFYEMFNDYEGMRTDLVTRNRWFEGMNLSYLIEEIKAIMKNTTYDQMQVFIYDNYITYLHKAHRQLINEIAQFEAVSKTDEPEVEEKEIKNYYPFNFNDETAMLEINGKLAKFKKDTRKLALLKLLIKKPKGIYYDEAVDELEGAVTDEAMNTKNIYYEACRGIEISLAKVGITDFLHYDYNQAKINPIYKKTT